MEAKENPEGAKQTAGSLRPSLSFESVTFSDGQTLTFDEDEIVVFVGPNNAGKSEALRQLQNFVARSVSQTVVRGAKLRKAGTSEQLREYLESHALKTGKPSANDLTYGGIGFNIHHTHLGYFNSDTDRHPVAPFFSTRLATEDRITASNPAGSIALYEQPPSHPIHLLLQDSALAKTISDLFKRAFGKDLIVFRAGGSSFPLYVGNKPALAAGEDELMKSYVDRLRANAISLQLQGDGMRSFATVLLFVLAADNHSIQFLDEPEAFLHPPQARLLGEYIARNRRAKSQLFVATHSTDVLDGLLAAGSDKVRIVRMQRDGDINRIKELSKDKAAEISKDTLTRYSGVFKGIFYRHVIITEADGDCLFYNSLLEAKSISGELQPDVLFVHISGKHRMGQLVDTMRSLGVPTSVIADFDILSEEPAFKGLFEKLGGDWDAIKGHWQAIKKSIEGARPPLNATQVKSMLMQELEKVAEGVGVFPKDIERSIKGIFKSVSPWDIVKRVGRSALQGSQSVSHFDQLDSKCSALGLWIVPVGEVEGFCRSIDAGHGPAFAEKVIEQRDLEADSELQEAREFVRRIWNAAQSRVS
jgi:hypothetical protein